MFSIYPMFKNEIDSVKEGDGFFSAYNEITGCDLIPTFSARSALVLGLQEYGMNRMDEIVVPPYLGYCVLNTINRLMFPARELSERSKALFVYSQFGYPQNFTEIERVAKERGLLVINDCINGMFIKLDGEYLIQRGDFSILSLSKMYHSCLGGALFTKNKKIHNLVSEKVERSSIEHKKIATSILEEYKGIQKKKDNVTEIDRLKISSLYGSIPDIHCFPTQINEHIPCSKQKLESDIKRRKEILEVVENYFGERLPESENCQIVPWAVPITGNEEKLRSVADDIRNEMDIDTPILHFDYNLNMLNPDYKKALVIGCHSDWNLGSVDIICKKMLKKGC